MLQNVAYYRGYNATKCSILKKITSKLFCLYLFIYYLCAEHINRLKMEQTKRLTRAEIIGLIFDVGVAVGVSFPSSEKVRLNTITTFYNRMAKTLGFTKGSEKAFIVRSDIGRDTVSVYRMINLPVNFSSNNA